MARVLVAWKDDFDFAEIVFFAGFDGDGATGPDAAGGFLEDVDDVAFAGIEGDFEGAIGVGFGTGDFGEGGVRLGVADEDKDVGTFDGFAAFEDDFAEEGTGFVGLGGGLGFGGFGGGGE